MTHSGAELMAQQLRALAAHPAATKRQLPTICNSSHRGSDTVLWPPVDPGMYMVYTQAKLTEVN